MEVTAVEGDITTQHVDAIVNAANRSMRGGGGVDGAIHAAAGPGLLAECRERFPHGLATGAAGWTTGHDLPARWVIHVVGPNRNAGETDRGLLVSCYANALAVADELGVALPGRAAGVRRGVRLAARRRGRGLRRHPARDPDPGHLRGRGRVRAVDVPRPWFVTWRRPDLVHTSCRYRNLHKNL